MRHLAQVSLLVSEREIDHLLISLSGGPARVARWGGAAG
jgi:hypothetical protein